MQHFKVLRSVSLLLVFALFTFGCDINQVSNAKMELKAEAIPEGILLHLTIFHRKQIDYLSFFLVMVKRKLF